MKILNVSPRPLLLTLSLLATPPAMAAGSSLDLPEMGDPSATILSAEEDKKLGQAFMRNLRMQARIIESPEINAYINALGYRLLSSAGSDLPFTFFVVDDPAINAFAGPGGYIGIHSGLIMATESEGELASVLAHEIAHVTQRHLARAFQKASASSMQTFAALLAAILVGNPAVAQAAIALTAAGNIQQQLNFTREHEREADRVGIETLAQAGFDPRQMPAFFSRLQQSTRYMESNLPELLRTHPVTPARIADSSNRAEQYPRLNSSESDDFRLIQALLHTLHDERQQRLKTLDAIAQPTTAQIYEKALWHLSSNDLRQAESLCQKLLEEHPEKPLFIALQTKIELQQGRTETAERRLEEALRLYPGHTQLTLLQVEVLLQLDKGEEAATAMRQLISQQERFALPSFFQLLAKAEMAAGHESDAYLAMAEYYYQLGQSRTAIEQLKMALERTREDDQFRRQRLNTRLEDIQGELLEQERKEGKPNSPAKRERGLPLS